MVDEVVSGSPSEAAHESEPSPLFSLPDEAAVSDSPKKPWNTERRQSRRRHGLFVFACLYTFLFIGAFYGWGPMQLMLEENGTFSSKCDGYDFDENDSSDDICPAQSSALVNVHFYANMMQMASPLFGLLLDRYGPVFTAYLMAIIGWIGLTLLILATSYSDVMLYPAFQLMGLSTFLGAMLMIHTGMVFAEGNRMRQRVIITLNAMFDAGSITWLGLWAIDKGTSGSFTLSNLLTMYLVCSVLIFGTGLYLWTVVEPEQAITNVEDDEEGEEEEKSTKSDADEVVPDTKAENDASIQEESKSEMLPSDEAKPVASHAGSVSKSIAPQDTYILVRDRTFRQQIVSLPFGAFVVFWTIAVTYNQYILTTTRDFLAFLGDDETGNKYLTIFTLLMPASLVAVPFTDETLEKIGFHGGFQAINGMGLAFSLIRLLSDNLNVQVIGFVLFSFWRSFLFGVSFSFFPTLLSPSVVGKATGIVYALTGATAFLNVPITDYAIEEKGGDFFIPNLIYTCLIGVCVLAAWYLGKVNRREKHILETRRRSSVVAASQSSLNFSFVQ
mmetsp:Transcript_22493/g.62435  ORF Transcript_22493/g.62435 Transcript_22493/m.62435 type:complete len:557 (+) Transcript_22493:133-1803(+)